MAEMTKDELLEALFIAKTGNSIDGRIAANFAKQGITDDSALPKPTLPSCCGVENHGNAYVYVDDQLFKMTGFRWAILIITTVVLVAAFEPQWIAKLLGF